MLPGTADLTSFPLKELARAGSNISRSFKVFESVSLSQVEAVSMKPSLCAGGGRWAGDSVQSWRGRLLRLLFLFFYAKPSLECL